MPRLLFWNTGRNGVGSLLQSIVRTKIVDLIILAELKDSPVDILQMLNIDRSDFSFWFGYCPKLAFFSRFDLAFLDLAGESDRSSIRTITLPGYHQVTIAAAHLPSQMHFSVPDISFECVELARRIRDVECKLGHSRTIFMGDLNLNPFDHGLVTASGLNAVMSRQIALKAQRVVQGVPYPFFYNPMWSHLGDRSGSTAGTFYYEQSKPINFFWHTFDQILLRPAFISGFNHEQIQVLTHAGPQRLIREDGRPESDSASDHLPIVLDIPFRRTYE